MFHVFYAVSECFDDLEYCPLEYFLFILSHVPCNITIITRTMKTNPMMYASRSQRFIPGVRFILLFSECEF